DNRVGAASGATATFSVQFASAITDLDSAIATNDQTKLNAAGLLLNQTIGLAMDPKYGSSAAVMGFAYDAVGYAAECAGLNVTDWRDPCKIFAQRSSGFLADFVNFIQQNLNKIPIVGPYVVDPVLGEFKKLLVDAQTGMATAAGGILAAIQALLTILDVAGPNDATNQIRGYILNLVGITNPPPQCAQGGGCQGVIMAVQMLLNAALALLNKLGVPKGITDLLTPIVNNITQGLNSGSTTLITDAAAALRSLIGSASGIVSAANLLIGWFGIPFDLKGITDALNIILNGLEAILSCWVTNPKV
ncbi:hypothetical protein BGZ83_009638, partial [Gryganskiella cystojenkinii]